MEVQAKVWGQETGMKSSLEVTKEDYKFWPVPPDACVSTPGELDAWRRVGELVHLLSRVLEEHTEGTLWQQTRAVHLCAFKEQRRETPQ